MFLLPWQRWCLWDGQWMRWCTVTLFQMFHVSAFELLRNNQHINKHQRSFTRWLRTLCCHLEEPHTRNNSKKSNKTICRIKMHRWEWYKCGRFRILFPFCFIYFYATCTFKDLCCFSVFWNKFLSCWWGGCWRPLIVYLLVFSTHLSGVFLIKWE